MKISLLITCLLLWGATKSPMGIVRHDVDLERYRELGRMPEFNCVGRYSSRIGTDDYAAGVLIADRWVLTASHFMTDSSVWMFGNTHYKSKRTVRHPNLKPGASELQWTGWDLVLVELTEPVKNTRPASRYYGNEEMGFVVVKIGYGYVGDGMNGMKNPRVAERLGGQNTIDAVGGIFESRAFTTDVLAFDFDSPQSDATNKMGSPDPLELEIGGSKGDSGGGVFSNVDGEWKLVGIVSGALNREIKYGAVAALARVSSANRWIDSIINVKKYSTK